MGNPQHLRWLISGVKSWNARRLSRPFTPDLSNMDITAAFQSTRGRLIRLARIDLSGANLTRSRLEGVDLTEADLSGAFLIGASLRGSALPRARFRETSLADANLVHTDCTAADFTRADLDRTDFGRATLRDADLRRAHMKKTYFGEADLSGVDVRTHRPDGQGTPRFTYLNGARGFTQAQADTMRGDRGTTLPDGFALPPSWPSWRDYDVIEQPTPPVEISYNFEAPFRPEEQTPSGQTADPLDSGGHSAARSAALTSQVNMLVRTAPAAGMTAVGLATLIDAAVSEFRANAGNDIPDEVLRMDDLAQTLRALGSRLTPERKAPDTAALEAEIDRLNTVIEGLTADLAAATAERENRFVAAFLEKGGSALGGAIFGGLGTSLVAGCGFLLGAYAPEAVSALGEVIGRLTAASAAPG